MTDLILFNANAVTMDPIRPFAELIAVDGGKIVFVGNNDMLGSLKRMQPGWSTVSGRHCSPALSTHIAIFTPTPKGLFP